MTGYPKITYRALDADRHEYEVRVQAGPGGPVHTAGLVQRSGTLPSMQRWRGITTGSNWSARSWDTRAQAGTAIASRWLACQHAARFTAYTQRVIGTAKRSGRTVSLDMAEGQRLVRVTVDGPGRESLFGAFYVSAARGTIVRGFFCHGNSAPERRYEGAQAVRQVITSWAAIERSKQHA